MSDETWDALVREVSTEGARRYAGWDAPIFDLLVSYAGHGLWSGLRKEPRRDKVLRAWLKLTAEAVGLGYLDRASGPYLLAPKGPVPESLTLLGRCLVQWARQQLPAYPAEQAVELLARTWNLCEGLATQPLWLNRYVAAAAAEGPALEKLEEFLVTTLEPALTPARRAAFSGPFTLSMLDTRELTDAFLPGDMHLAAPCVVCVHDRRHEDSRLGLFLTPEGRTRFLGLLPCLGQGSEEETVPVESRRNAVAVHGKEAALPLVGQPYRTLAARGGFVVASAEDSQRLWVLDTP